MLSRADHVVGKFPREVLSGALSAVHRSGFGHHVRVFDGTRQPVGDQLVRAGLRLVDVVGLVADDLLIVVTAPGRTAIVAEMFHQTGATEVILAERAVARTLEAEPVAMPLIDGDLGEAAGS